MEVKIHVVVFWVVTPFILVDWYQRFRGTCSFHLQGSGDQSQI